MKTPYNFYPHQSEKKIAVSAQMREAFGNFPLVTALMYDENGGLHQESIPVDFELDEFDQVKTVIAKTGNRYGILILS